MASTRKSKNVVNVEQNVDSNVNPSTDSNVNSSEQTEVNTMQTEQTANEVVSSAAATSEQTEVSATNTDAAADNAQPEQTEVNTAAAAADKPADASAELPATIDAKIAKAIKEAFFAIEQRITGIYANIDAVMADSLDADATDEEKQFVARQRIKALAKNGLTGDATKDIAKAASEASVLGMNVLTYFPIACNSLLDKKDIFTKRLQEINNSPEFKLAAAGIIKAIAAYKALCKELGIDPSYTVMFEDVDGAPCISHKGTRHAKTVSADGTVIKQQRNMYDALSANLNVTGHYTNRVKLHLVTTDAAATITATDSTDGKELGRYETFRSSAACKLRNMQSVSGWLRKFGPQFCKSNTELNMSQCFPGIANLYDKATIVTPTEQSSAA